MVETLAREGAVALDPVGISRRRNRIFLERFIDAVKPVPAVVQVARDADSRGLRLAIATGGHRGTFESSLRRLGLDSLFEVRVAREDVERGKPAPDLFVLALDRLGVDPERALVYEDSDEGLAAAAAAGIAAVDVRPLVAPDRIPGRSGID
jgi:HAD superfamily hydrolase (TIGR01509 family)